MNDPILIAVAVALRVTNRGITLAITPRVYRVIFAGCARVFISLAICILEVVIGTLGIGANWYSKI